MKPIYVLYVLKLLFWQQCEAVSVCSFLQSCSHSEVIRYSDVVPDRLFGGNCLSIVN